MQFYQTAQCHRCRRFWGSVQLAGMLMLTAGISTRAVACELNVHFSTISRLQSRFREFGSTSNRPHNRRPRVTTPAQDLHHIQHLQDRLRPATRTAAATIGLYNQRISAQTVRNRLREAHLHGRNPHRGPTWVGKCSHLMASGTLERCSLHRWIPVFTVPGRWQTACMASCGWAVCWCKRCGSSGPWGYGMARCMLWTLKPLKRSGPTFYRPQSTTWSTLCEEDVLHCVR